MSVTIHSLAPELLDHILDLVRGSGVPSSTDDARHTNSHLLSAALVSRGLAEAAQRVLWRDARIILDQEEPFDIIPSSKFPIQHLWIAHRGHVAFKDTNRAIGAATDWTRALLEVAPHLQSLCLTTSNDRVGPEWSFLRSASLHELRRLDLEYCYEVEDPIDISTPFPFHLTHLGLTLYATTPSAHLLRALFATSRDSLASLRLTSGSILRWDVSEPYSDGMYLVGPRLKYLEIIFNSCMPHNAPECFHLDRLSTLTHFKFIAKGALVRLHQYLGLLPSPATLTHLALDLFHDGFDTVASDQAGEINLLLSNPALAQLREISLGSNKSKYLGGGEGGRALIEECERRSIRLVQS